MSIRQTSIIVASFALFVGGSVVLAEPLLKNKLQSSSDSGQLLAQAPSEGRDRREGKREGKRGPERLLEQLNLSDQQKQQLETIKQKYQGQMEPLKENMRTLRQDLQTMMAGTASATEIRAKHQELAQLNQQMRNIRFEGMLEMREILTPQQRNKFAQLMNERRQNSRQRMTPPPDGNEMAPPPEGDE